MKVSIAQMCSSSEPEKNLQLVRQAFIDAANQDSEILVLPENMMAMAARFKAICTTDWAPLLEVICALAAEHSLPCVAGTIPLADPEQLNKRLASSLFINASGQIKHTYNKIHLFDVDVGDEKGSYRESNYYSPGKTPVLFDLGAARIGMAVCFDLRFPNLFQEYKKQGANVILLPSAFTALTGKKHWEILLRARAIETQCFIVAPNQVGTHDDGRVTWGHSMIVSPDGDVLLDLKQEQGVATYDINIASVELLRATMPLIPHFQQD